MYELLFSSQQPKAKGFRKYCCNVLFSHAPQQLTSKMEKDLQQTITGMQEKHQFAIEEHELAIALLNDGLHERDNLIQVIQYEYVALQAQRDVYQSQLQRCEDTITHLRERYMDHSRDPTKDNNIIIIVRKYTTSTKYHDLPYYVARIQRHL